MDVPIMKKNRNIKGWNSITDSAALYDTVVERNQEHLCQAYSMPLGHGEGYYLFRSPDRHETVKAVLEGQLQWEYPVEEVNECFANLKIAHNRSQMETKINAINADISVDLFQHYFKHKDESTELFPSG